MQIDSRLQLLAVVFTLASCATGPTHDNLAVKETVAAINTISGNQRMMPVPMVGGVSILVPVGVPASYLVTVNGPTGSLTVRTFRQFDIGACVAVRTGIGGVPSNAVLEPAQATVSADQGC
jgi:hypothetical protein